MPSHPEDSSQLTAVATRLLYLATYSTSPAQCQHFAILCPPSLPLNNKPWYGCWRTHCWLLSWIQRNNRSKENCFLHKLLLIGHVSTTHISTKHSRTRLLRVFQETISRESQHKVNPSPIGQDFLGPVDSVGAIHPRTSPNGCWPFFHLEQQTMPAVDRGVYRASFSSITLTLRPTNSFILVKTVHAVASYCCQPVQVAERTKETVIEAWVLCLTKNEKLWLFMWWWNIFEQQPHWRKFRTVWT